MKRIVFMGTPFFAKVVLERLIKEAFEIVLVVTKADRIQGRKKEVIYSDVKKLALEYNLPLHQPEKLRLELDPILALKPDLIITAAYGQILPKVLLDQIKAINVHGSLLPSYRGGAPIQYALFDGLKKTGVTIMDMDYKMDSGDMILQGEIDIEESDTYSTLSSKMAYLGADLLIKVLKGSYPRIKQDEAEVSFAYTLKRADEYLDFTKDADTVINRLRGLLDEPAASILVNNETYKIYNVKKSDIIANAKPGEIILENKKMLVATSSETIEVLEIQAPGKKRMNIKDFLNGQKNIKTGDKIERVQ